MSDWRNFDELLWDTMSDDERVFKKARKSPNFKALYEWLDDNEKYSLDRWCYSIILDAVLEILSKSDHGLTLTETFERLNSKIERDYNKILSYGGLSNNLIDNDKNDFLDGWLSIKPHRRIILCAMLLDYEFIEKSELIKNEKLILTEEGREHSYSYPSLKG